MKKYTIYDKSKEYDDSEIVDTILKLKWLCNKFEIPMFLSMAIQNDENKTTYKNELISAVSSGIELKDDKFID